jgi:hypothetical protein
VKRENRLPDPIKRKTSTPIYQIYDIYRNFAWRRLLAKNMWAYINLYVSIRKLQRAW